jgi:hypothetical protein
MSTTARTPDQNHALLKAIWSSSGESSLGSSPAKRCWDNRFRSRMWSLGRSRLAADPKIRASFRSQLPVSLPIFSTMARSAIVGGDCGAAFAEMNCPAFPASHLAKLQPTTAGLSVHQNEISNG